MTRAYAGIGSQRTPPDVLALMTQTARRLARLGLTLRTGGADGADDAFLTGTCGTAELYLPWPGFNGWPHGLLLRPKVAAFQVAARCHPAWHKLSPRDRSLHARNAHQVLGADLNDPVLFVLCWTPDGATLPEETSRATGGTGQAIRIAGYQRPPIPVFNLRWQEHRARAEALDLPGIGRGER